MAFEKWMALKIEMCRKKKPSFAGRKSLALTRSYTRRPEDVTSLEHMDSKPRVKGQKPRLRPEYNEALNIDLMLSISACRSPC